MGDADAGVGFVGVDPALLQREIVQLDLLGIVAGRQIDVTGGQRR